MRRQSKGSHIAAALGFHVDADITINGIGLQSSRVSILVVTGTVMDS